MFFVLNGLYVENEANDITKEFVPIANEMDGRCKRSSPYQTVTLTVQNEILERLIGMKISELKQEILRLELEKD